MNPRFTLAVALVVAAVPLATPVTTALAAEITSQAMASKPSSLTVSGGLSALLLQSYLVNDLGLAINAELEGRPRPGWAWTVGGRLGLGPALPEGFVRWSAAPPLGRWSPAVGLELGITSRTRYELANGGVGQALRAQAEDEASPFYISIHATPLRFAVWRHWRISLVELQVGSHLGRLGEHARIQVGLLSLAAGL